MGIKVWETNILYQYTVMNRASNLILRRTVHLFSVFLYTLLEYFISRLAKQLLGLFVEDGYHSTYWVGGVADDRRKIHFRMQV